MRLNSKIEGTSASMDGRSPFALRVGQIMTGFGAGCGIGVGLGYPIAARVVVGETKAGSLWVASTAGSIPVLGDVVRPITSAGSQAFGGVGYRAMGLLKKLGIKNLKAGVGCGVGIGHGFGAGLALKPGVLQQLTHTAQKKITGLTIHLQKQLSSREAESKGASMTMQPSSVPDDVFLGEKLAEAAPVMLTEYVPSELPTPPLNTQAVDSPSPRGRTVEEDLRHENQVLRTLLKHQELIEDLREENAALRHLLNEQVDLQSVGNRVDLRRKLSAGRNYRGDPLCTATQSYGDHSCKNCFDCRRQSRRRRRLE